MRISIVLLAILTFSLFGLALRVVFTSRGRQATATRLVVIVGSAFSCLHVSLLVTADLQPWGVALGAALYTSGCALFVWTARSVRGRDFRLAYSASRPVEVFARGPYRWVRHPFYLSYTLAWLAGIVALSDGRLLPTLTVMLAFYVGAAYLEERQLLRGPTASDYRAYRRQVGLLLPRL